VAIDQATADSLSGTRPAPAPKPKPAAPIALSRAARLARVGVIAFNGQSAGYIASGVNSARRALTELRGRLDAIRGDGELSARERRGAVAAALKAADEQLQAAGLDMSRGRASVNESIAKVDAAILAREQRVSMVALERLRAHAAVLRELSPDQMSKVVDRATATRDVDTMLAWSLVPGCAAAGLRAVGVLLAPADFEHSLRAGELLAGEAAVRLALAGVADLAKVDAGAPGALDAVDDPLTLLTLANAGGAALGAVPEQAPATWPQWTPVAREAPAP
jgi:hypothetical protein